ncbi:hypothetical protein LAN29_25100, partial [Mycobacterium tuberculosis]|nr:hypothetical protein [Mycobacterium tuberculosis]
TEMHKFRWNDTANRRLSGELSAGFSNPGRQVLRDAIEDPAPHFKNLAKWRADRSGTAFSGSSRWHEPADQRWQVGQ